MLNILVLRMCDWLSLDKIQTLPLSLFNEMKTGTSPTPNIKNYDSQFMITKQQALVGEFDGDDSCRDSISIRKWIRMPCDSIFSPSSSFLLFVILFDETCRLQPLAPRWKSPKETLIESIDCFWSWRKEHHISAGDFILTNFSDALDYSGEAREPKSAPGPGSN